MFEEYLKIDLDAKKISLDEIYQNLAAVIQIPRIEIGVRSVKEVVRNHEGVLFHLGSQEIANVQEVVIVVNPKLDIALEVDIVLEVSIGQGADIDQKA